MQTNRSSSPAPESPVTDAVVNPWRFLTALDGTSEIDRQLVQVTRPDEVQLISHMVAAARVSVLYSFSGNGKSSIVNAGLIPFLTTNRYAVFRVRPRPPWSIEGPTQAFKESILRDVNLPLLRRSDFDLLRRVKDGFHGASQVERDQLDGLIARLEEQAKLSAQSEQHSEALRADLKQYVDKPLAEFISRVQMRLEPDTTLAFICDQFEELFVHFGNTPALDEFVSQLGQVWADGSLRVRILFSMREDWVGSLIEFRKAIPDIFRDYFKLKPITRSRASHVLTLPLEAMGASIEPRAVDAILDDLAASYVRTQQERFSGINLTPSSKDDPFIELPALQVVADKLWATRNRVSTPFSLAHYRSLANHAPDGNGSASPAQTVLNEYLADLLAGAEDPGDLSPREFLELRLDCLYLLTDRARHRRALPEGLLLEELKQIRPQSLDLPAVTPARLQHALQPLERHRLVREDVSRSGDRQYELAHDFAVRSVVVSWRQLDRERTATLAVLERERRQTAQKVAVLKDADRRSTQLLQLAPLLGFVALTVALIASRGFDYSGLSSHPFLTGLLLVPFMSIVIAGLLRGHRPSAVFGGAGLIGAGGATLSSGYDVFGWLALLTAALVPLYLWSAHTLSTQTGSRFARLFATLWTEYVEVLKVAVGVGVAATAEKAGASSEMTILLLITTTLVTTSVSGYQIARRGYQTGHAWTGRRVTRANGESLSVALGIIRQVGLLAWIALVVLVVGLIVDGVTNLGDEGPVIGAVLSVIAWIAGAAFIAGLDEEQRHIYDRVSGAHVTSNTVGRATAAVSLFDAPRAAKRFLIPAFAIAVAGMALVAFTYSVAFGFSESSGDALYRLIGDSAFRFNRELSLIAGGILAISAAGFFFQRTRLLAAWAVFGTFAVQLLFSTLETVVLASSRFEFTAGRIFDTLEMAALTLTVIGVSTASDRAQKRLDTARVAFAVGLIGSGMLFLSSGLGRPGLMMLWTVVVQIASIATGILLVRQRHASRACLVLTAIFALNLIFRALEEMSQGDFSVVWIPRSLMSIIGTATWAVLLAQPQVEAPAAVEAVSA